MIENPIDMLYDENNSEPIVLYSETGEEIIFDQIAIIPLNGNTYAILQPQVLLEGMEENEALVFELVTPEEETILKLVVDDKVIDDVFQVYYDLLAEEENT